MRQVTPFSNPLMFLLPVCQLCPVKVQLINRKTIEAYEIFLQSRIIYCHAESLILQSNCSHLWLYTYTYTYMYIYTWNCGIVTIHGKTNHIAHKIDFETRRPLPSLAHVVLTKMYLYRPYLNFPANNETLLRTLHTEIRIKFILCKIRGPTHKVNELNGC